MCLAVVGSVFFFSTVISSMHIVYYRFVGRSARWYLRCSCFFSLWHAPCLLASMHYYSNSNINKAPKHEFVVSIQLNQVNTHTHTHCHIEVERKTDSFHTHRTSSSRFLFPHRSYVFRAPKLQRQASESRYAVQCAFFQARSGFILGFVET